MMSTLGGGRGIPKCDNSTDKLCERDSDKRRGVKKPKNFWTSYVNGPKLLFLDMGHLFFASHTGLSKASVGSLG